MATTTVPAGTITGSGPDLSLPSVTLPSSGGLLSGVAGPFVWAAAAFITIALAGTAVGPVVIALLAAAIWWQFLHAKKG